VNNEPSKMAVKKKSNDGCKKEGHNLIPSITKEISLEGLVRYEDDVTKIESNGKFGDAGINPLE
jgi:hypothetical protein